MRDIIVIGASAGGVEALTEIGGQLPSNIRAAVFVVIHVSPRSNGLLPNILNRKSSVPAHQAEDGEPIQIGKIYVAPPDRHMLLEGDHVQVVKGPKHNRHRPAIDLLFRTAARNFGERVIGVVLTGFLDDGSSGLLAIKNAGGIAVVQNPEDAEVASMPRNALLAVQADYCVPLSEMGVLLGELTQTEVKSMSAKASGNGSHLPEKKQTLTSFTCPDCHGTIWEVEENGEIRFECRIGHAYAPDAFADADDDSVERSLWVALRSMEESASVQKRLADMAHERNRPGAYKRFSASAESRKQHAAVLREFLVGSKRRQSEAEGDNGKRELRHVS